MDRIFEKQLSKKLDDPAKIKALGAHFTYDQI